MHTVDDDTRNDPTTLINWLDEHNITITFIPTPLAETLLEHPWPPNSPLRYLLTGGDTLHHHPNPDHPYTLINHYGPTETTVVATATATTGITPTTQPPTIGTPITNTTITIIDPAGHTAGPYQPGELTISGPTLARGYHHDPTLTTHRFIATRHPHPPAYHTGDLARWNHDGTITYLGRTDHQLKIRGHRIEPAELETIITTHPHITHTTITTHPHPTTNTPQLCAYITTTPPTPTPAQLDDHVAAWQALYERTYSEGRPDHDGFDIRGWNASDRGTPLGPAVMGEQVDQTVDRILALRPRIDPRDRLRNRSADPPAGPTLRPLRRHRLLRDGPRPAAARASTRRGLGPRRAARARATDLDGIDGPFDVVVLNSVVQYFPSLDYLRRVLDRCVDRVPRTAPCSSATSATTPSSMSSTPTSNAPAPTVAPPSTSSLRASLGASPTSKNCSSTRAGSPSFAADHPRVTHVAAEPRRGHLDTELTRYRYDVTLTFDDRAAVFDGPWIDWDTAGLTAGELPARPRLGGDANRRCPRDPVGAPRPPGRHPAGASPVATDSSDCRRG